MSVGRIKWFSPSKGYGFVTGDDGTDFFLHYSGLADGQERRLFPGDRVEFAIAPGEKGAKAVDLVCTERAERPEPTLPEGEGIIGNAADATV